MTTSSIDGYFSCFQILQSQIILQWFCIKKMYWLGAVAHACNILALGRRRWVDHEVKRSRPSWSTGWNPVPTKNTKIIWASCWAPVIPATWEDKAGELLEPERQRLQWAEIMLLHSSLGNKSEIPSQKKIKNKNKKCGGGNNETDALYIVFCNDFRPLLIPKTHVPIHTKRILI